LEKGRGWLDSHGPATEPIERWQKSWATAGENRMTISTESFSMLESALAG
jgi:hypothetical protein